MTVKIFSDTHEGVAYHRQLDRLHAREAEATRAENRVAHLRQEANFSVEESASLQEMIGKRMRFRLHRQRAKLQARDDKLRESMTLNAQASSEPCVPLSNASAPPSLRL